MGSFTFYFLDTTNTNSVALNSAEDSISFEHALKNTSLTVLLIIEDKKLCRSYFNFLKEGHGVSIMPHGPVVQLENASPGTVVHGRVFENTAPSSMAVLGHIIPQFIGIATITVARK